MAEASWQPDPTGRHDYRYWDGSRWTENVSDAGLVSSDPIAPGRPGPQGGPAPSAPGAQPTPYMPAAAGVVPQRHQNTVAAFVLGLLSVVCCSILGPIAWLMARSARRDTAGEPGRYRADDGLLTAAFVLGIIGTVFLAATIVYFSIALATGNVHAYFRWEGAIGWGALA